MRRFTLAFLLGVLITAPVTAASPQTEPFRLRSWSEQNYGANRPWLDPTCYDDDHVAHGYAAGWLTAGSTWVFESPRLVCNEKIQRGWLQFAKRLDGARLSLIDYGLHPVDDWVYSAEKGLINRVSCNTALGTLHVDLDPVGDEPGEPASVATWVIAAPKAGWYELVMTLDEPWWQGRESMPNWCPDDGFFDW